MNTSATLRSQNIAEAFSRQSSSFDKLDAENEILQYMRSTVRKHVLSFLKKGDTILELNCGTGLDAIYFAGHGFKVFATDNSEGMLQQARKKITSALLQNNITFQNCSFDNLNQLYPLKFDHIFSNFGGLNCSTNLQSVISQFNSLLNDGGTVVLVLMPPICPWEIALALKGNIKIAFRRFNKNGAAAKLEGVQFKTYYYSPKQIQRFFGSNYKLVHLQSLGLTCPPPYLENFPKRFPRLFKTLLKADKKLSSYPLLRNWGDHFILTMKKES